MCCRLCRFARNSVIALLCAGSFQLTEPDKIAKHAHLRFTSTSNMVRFSIRSDSLVRSFAACCWCAKVLSFVDVRRFGGWEVADFDFKNRGDSAFAQFF